MGKTSKSGQSGRESPADNRTDELSEVVENNLIKKKTKGKKVLEDIVEEPVKKSSRRKKRAAPEPEPEPEEEEEEEEEAVESEYDLDAAAGTIAAYKKAEGAAPTASELGSELGISEAQAKEVLKQLKKRSEKLSNERRRAKVRGYRKLAEEAGFAYDAGVLVERGTDSLKSLVSMSDALRLTQFVPYTPNAPSYDKDEFQARMELASTALPEGAAREVVANVDSVFKHLINEAVGVTVHQRGAQRVQPSVMVSVCKPYADRMSFSSVIAAPGLAKFLRDEAPPADSAKLGAYLNRVPFADRGLGLVDADSEHMDAAKMRKDAEKAARSNGAGYTKMKATITKEKLKKKKDREALKSAGAAVAA